jgi:hypothetical protein
MNLWKKFKNFKRNKKIHFNQLSFIIYVFQFIYTSLLYISLESAIPRLFGWIFNMHLINY